MGNMSIRAKKKNIPSLSSFSLVYSTDEELISSHNWTHKHGDLCKACGEPLYYERCETGYCDACTSIIDARIKKLKDNLKKNPSKLYREEYSVIDISQNCCEL